MCDLAASLLFLGIKYSPVIDSKSSPIFDMFDLLVSASFFRKLKSEEEMLACFDCRFTY
jgi:hypothetical protein